VVPVIKTIFRPQYVKDRELLGAVNVDNPRGRSIRDTREVCRRIGMAKILAFARWVTYVHSQQKIAGWQTLDYKNSLGGSYRRRRRLSGLSCLSAPSLPRQCPREGDSHLAVFPVWRNCNTYICKLAAPRHKNFADRPGAPAYQSIAPNSICAKPPAFFQTISSSMLIEVDHDAAILSHQV
jgi:hypothetical protein